MYLHIGNDIMLHNKDILGIFNLKYIKNTKEYKSMYKDLDINGNIINISEDMEKAFILVEKNKDIKGIVTKVGVGTIMKRLV